MKEKFCRWTIYTAGMVLLAFGLTLNTKTGLGVSPILSLAYSSAVIWEFSLGDATLVLYTFFVAAQLVIRGKNRQWHDLLQLPLTLVFSRGLDVFDRWVSYDCAAHSIWSNLALLAAAILVTGAAVALVVNMRLVPNPADGFVQAIADVTGREQGVTKNLCDLCCVLLTCLLSLVTTGRIIGVGLGTVAAMIGVGRVISLTNYLLKDKLCRAAGLA